MGKVEERQKVGRKQRHHRATNWPMVISVLTFAGVLTTGIFTAINYLFPRYGAGAAQNAPTIGWLQIATISGLVLLLAVILLAATLSIRHQANVEYERLSYDPTMILKWQDTFDDLCESGKVAKAATLSKEFLKVNDWSKVANANEIEYVLDFLDDLGFYLDGNLFSDEVVHHHFYHYIRLFLQKGVFYIDQERKRLNEPKKWEHCELLLARVTAIEFGKPDPTATEAEWNTEKLTRYFDDELPSAKAEGATPAS